jgi:hypothetical protein
VQEIYDSLGAYYFQRAYRMTYQSFQILVNKLSPVMVHSDFSHARVNGPIANATCVAVALRYFAGGCPCDIAPLFGIGHVEVTRSVWRVVEATNNLDEFKIEYPSCHKAQKKIAKEFAS